MGENPIKETITLIDDKWGDYYLKLSPDGTALCFDENLPQYEFKYTYNMDKQEIYMQVEKYAYYLNDGELLTYNDCLSLIDSEYIAASIKELIRNEYNDGGKEEFGTYEEFEKNWIEEVGFKSLDEFVEDIKQDEKTSLKAIFGALPTYYYEIDSDSKMTLTEKFTGVKNLFMSICEYHESETSIRIYNSSAYFQNNDNDEYFNGAPDTDKKTIAFKSKDDGTTVNATYTEDISEGTVTLNFNGKKYVCEFEGVNFAEK